MPTMRDVAKLAGVAPITVSRVINDTGYISPETRARVEAAIGELGYVPNTLARSLRSRQTGMLALVLTDVTNPFFTTVARGVEDAASDAGFNLILCNTDESKAKQDKYVQVLLQKQVDGVLLVPARGDAESIRHIRKQGVPVVLLDRRLSRAKSNDYDYDYVDVDVDVVVDVVRCDSKDGACELVRLLTSLGHRRIAMLSGPPEVSTAEDRLQGYRQALREAGLTIEAELVHYGEFTVSSGYEMARQALADAPRPTALFAGNNFIAIGALKALRDLQLQVPDDLAMVGFDDLPSGLVVDPFLTAAVQPAYEMGRRATTLLLDRLARAPGEARQEIVLPTEIVIRKSSGQPLPQQDCPKE